MNASTHVICKVRIRIGNRTGLPSLFCVAYLSRKNYSFFKKVHPISKRSKKEILMERVEMEVALKKDSSEKRKGWNHCHMSKASVRIYLWTKDQDFYQLKNCFGC